MQNFITIEGPEGGGKTTIIQSLKEELAARGLKVMSTREPGGIPTAELIRSLVLSDEAGDLDMYSQLLLFLAARKEHLEKVVKPFLETGGIVLCDRYVDSTLVYQGYLGGIPLETIYQLNGLIVGDYMPSHTLVIDVPSQVTVERLKDRGGDLNRYDKAGIETHDKIRESYLSLAESTFNTDERISLVDGVGTREEVLRRVLDTLAAKNPIFK